MKNRLASEKSPYLLQHAENPVDWHPWSTEAFRLAREQDKPLFISIGYAACHWCHVMAHESFEDEDVAHLMNRAFINIKVDREERPDIDSSCMRVCQLLTGQGGWPLNIVMTPDREPFYAATYIPRERRFNRPGMLELIPMIERAWREDRPGIMRSAASIREAVVAGMAHDPGPFPDQSLPAQAVNELSREFDDKHGGFGDAPWFPMPIRLRFLLHYGVRYDDSHAISMAERVLSSMRYGAIFDQIGFGFHRYATDREWKLPHFEKMLCDQALLADTYLDGFRLTGNPLFRRTLLEILNYTENRLTSPEGAFYSAEDADSEGEEGTYYLWRREEIQRLLGSELAELCFRFYQIKEEGNFRDETTGHHTGANLLFPGQKSGPELTIGSGELPEYGSTPMTMIRKKLLDARERRPRPLLDDKILTDWNGLMISALARAGAHLEQEHLIGLAERAYRFIETKLVTGDGELLHRYRDGEAAIPAMGDDYCLLIRASIDLYQATLRPSYLRRAISWNRRFVERFRDVRNGGFYIADPRTDPILLHEKPIGDGSTPPVNATAAMNLIRIGRLTGDPEPESLADEIFRLFSKPITEWPHYHLHALRSWMTADGPFSEIVICGERTDATLEMIRTVRRVARHPYVLMHIDESTREELHELAPFTRSFPAGSEPLAWVCRNFRCEAPAASPEALRERLDSQ